jgi:hypothetical protein
VEYGNRSHPGYDARADTTFQPDQQADCGAEDQEQESSLIDKGVIVALHVRLLQGCGG